MNEFIFDCKNSKDLEKLKLLIESYKEKILKGEYPSIDKERAHVVIVNYYLLENFIDLEKADAICKGFSDVFKTVEDVQKFLSTIGLVFSENRKINVSFEKWLRTSQEFDLLKKEIEERIMKQKEINKPKLVILPFLTSSVCSNNAQLYFQFKKEKMNGFYYIPLNLLLKIIKTDGLILNIDRLIKNPKTFWSGNEFFEYKFNGNVVVLSNNQVPSVLDYTKENCEKINKLNAIFLKENQNLEEHGQIHYFNEDYVRLVEERIVLN